MRGRDTMMHQQRRKGNSTPRKLPKTINEKQFLEVAKTIKNPKIKLAFMLGFYQCMRVSEIINLKPEDVDKDRGFIHVIAGKGNKDRDIPIMRPVSAGLRHLPVGVSRQALHKHVKKRLKDASMHTLRHSGATYYLNQKGINIRQIQQLLGHSRLDTTQIYTHVTPDDMKKSFDEVW